jgi:hypothetical protein
MPGVRNITTSGFRGADDGARILSHTVFLAELVYSSAGIDFLLFARVKRVARGTHFSTEILAEGRASCELVATTTGDFDVVVIGMDVGFHVLALPSGLLHKKGA